MIASRTFNVDAVTVAWTTLVREVGAVRAIEDHDQYVRSVAMLDSLLDAIRGDEDHPLQGLVALIGDLVEQYETTVLDEAAATPGETLRMLMEANSLRQSDLASELGGQSVVSEILNGRRQINAKQAGRLAARFAVSPALFIERNNVLEAEAATAHLEGTVSPSAPSFSIGVQRALRFRKPRSTSEAPKLIGDDWDAGLVDFAESTFASTDDGSLNFQWN